MLLTPDHVPLSTGPAEIGQITGGQTVTYARLYSAAVNLLIPADRIGARLYLRRSRLPEVAAHFGLTVAASAE